LDKNKYQVRIYKHTQEDDPDYKTINFIKIKSILEKNGEFNNGDHCAILIIDTKNKIANIQSVNNYKDSIKCYYEKDKTYKIGDILIQVMIYISLNKHMKTINLHDNSNYKCNKFNIPLINLRTITHGKPLYSKFGFYPINHNKENDTYYYKNEFKIYEDNKKIFISNPKMSKKELIDIIFLTKYDKIKDINMLEYINNIIIPRLKEKNNLISDFINNIINDSSQNKTNTSNELENTKKDIKKYDYESCKLLKNILMIIYNKCGYYDYIEKTFVLNLENKNTIQHYKNKLKLKNI
jgi:hypothetical protein